MKKQTKLPTILGLIILIAGTFAGVFFLNVRQVFRLGASPTDTPKDVRISNISDSSASISWVTDGESVGFIKWGENTNSLSKIANESTSGQKFKVHTININGLSPEKSYYFKINSNGTEFDNNSLPWQFSTGSVLDLEGDSFPVTGSVITASGQPVKRSLIYMNISGYLMSTLTSDSGSYIFQLGNARASNLKDYIVPDENGEILLEISVQSDSDNFAAAQIFPEDADPIPPIIMGQTMDFRNLSSGEVTSDPTASINLPSVGDGQPSKFDVTTTGTIAPSTTVILESHQNGEVISTDKPQFFGKAPQGTDLVITVHSAEEITGNVKVPKTGSWSWTPPTNLSAGEHTITVSWIDTSGITRSLARKFIVQAAEVPAFTASQSGTVSTPSPTPIIPTIQPSNTPTIAPVVEPTETIQPVPITGELTPTLFLFIMSIGILVFSFGVWKISENA